jgi:hypothetical protein
MELFNLEFKRENENHGKGLDPSVVYLFAYDICHSTRQAGILVQGQAVKIRVVVAGVIEI